MHREAQAAGTLKENTASQSISSIGSTTSEFTNINDASTPTTTISNDSNREPHSLDQNTDAIRSVIPTVTITGNKLFYDIVYCVVGRIVIMINQNIAKIGIL